MCGVWFLRSWVLGMLKVLLHTVATAALLACSGWLEAASLQAQVVDQQGHPLAGAVVTLRGGPVAATPGAKAIMDQRKQEFVPHVLAVRTGTLINFPNSDNIRHQVYSFSPPKRFELRLYEGTPTEPLLFDKPGVVVLGCNIHDWMLGYIYISDDPWFGVTDANGKLAIDQLPPGHYAVTLWHPQVTDMLNQSGGELDVAAAGASHTFSLAVQPPASDTAAAPAPSAFGNAFGNALSEPQK